MIPISFLNSNPVKALRELGFPVADLKETFKMDFEFFFMLRKSGLCINLQNPSSHFMQTWAQYFRNEVTIDAVIAKYAALGYKINQDWPSNMIWEGGFSKKKYGHNPI